MEMLTLLRVRTMLLSFASTDDLVLTRDAFLSHETHVCIQQTALELVGRGIEVHIVADATSSRSMMDRLFALEVGALST